jgi:hypothetical protein
MADLGFGDSGFDALAPENQRTNSVVPAGEYPAIMVESERKPTKAGDGFYLNTKWQIVSGEFQNRFVFERYNLWLNPSKDKALSIARGQFSELCRAVGVANPKDSSELHNKPCMIKVKIKKDEEYGEKNEISSYKPIGKQDVAATVASAGGNPW